MNRRDQYGLELVLSPLFVDVSASGDVTTRNQQVAQVISGDDKTLYLTQKVVTVRMLGDIAVANGTYTLAPQSRLRPGGRKGHLYAGFRAGARRLAMHQLAAHLLRQENSTKKGRTRPRRTRSTFRYSQRATRGRSKAMRRELAGAALPCRPCLHQHADEILFAVEQIARNKSHWSRVRGVVESGNHPICGFEES